MSAISSAAPGYIKPPIYHATCSVPNQKNVSLFGKKGAKFLIFLFLILAVPSQQQRKCLGFGNPPTWSRSFRCLVDVPFQPVCILIRTLEFMQLVNCLEGPQDGIPHLFHLFNSTPAAWRQKAHQDTVCTALPFSASTLHLLASAPPLYVSAL